MAPPKRIVITGIGPITPIGVGKDEYLEALLAGKSGAKRINFEDYDMEQYRSRIACPINGFELSDFLEKCKDFKRLGRTSKLAMAATKLALDDAGFNLEVIDRGKGKIDYRVKDIDPYEIGAIIGTGGENMDICEPYFRKFLEHMGPRRISPFGLPHTIVSSVPANVSNKFNIKGKCLTVASACASGVHATMEAFMQIQFGKESVMITGGAESCITPFVFGGFDALAAMTKRNDEPEKACRPFDKDRDGFLMGEGAGIIVLEELEHALNRGAHIYGEIKGFGASNDAYNIVAPDETGEPLAKAISDALDMAGIGPGEIDYINAHGTSTIYNDVTETRAIKKALGKAAYSVPISSTKSMTGHLIGGAGGIEIIATLLAMESGMIHPTINLDCPDDECDLDYVPHKPIRKSVHKALKINSGFGGFNVVLALSSFGDGVS